jgi:hypothetical protein
MIDHGICVIAHGTGVIDHVLCHQSTIANGTAIRRGSTQPAARAVADIALRRLGDESITLCNRLPA